MGSDLGATLRGDRGGAGLQRRGEAGDVGPSLSSLQTPDLSSSAAVTVASRRQHQGTGTAGAGAGGRRGLPAPAINTPAAGQAPPGYGGPLSPRRAAELAGRGYHHQGSVSSKGKGASREGSDGTPSMGSSFSDLDGKSRDATFYIFHGYC
jgi:hypothetical protein